MVKHKRTAGPRPEPPPNTLGGVLRLYRRKKDLSQEDVGQAVGVSGQSVSQWEQNEAHPSRKNLKKLAELFEVQLANLLDDASVATLADQAEHLNKQVAGLTQYPPPTSAPSRNHARNLLHVPEIHEDDFTSTVVDLRTVSEIYQWRLPEHVLSHSRNPADVRIMRISQDALHPLVSPGDYLIFDAGSTSLRGSRAIYLLVIDEQLTIVRRVGPVNPEADHPHNRLQYLLKAENPLLKDLTVNLEQIRVLGRVLGYLRLGI